MSMNDFYYTDIDDLIEIVDAYNTQDTFRIRNMWEIGRSVAINIARGPLPKGQTSIHDWWPLPWDGENPHHRDIEQDDIDFLKSLNLSFNK